MKIISGVLAALVLSLAEATHEDKELMKTKLPASAVAKLEKVAGALCSLDESPDLHYAVKLAKKIYNCDEEAAGMVANTATTVVAEALVMKSHSNHHGLAVSDEWGWAGEAVDTVTGAVTTGMEYVEIVCRTVPGVPYIC